jgi:hypothetical protein
MPSTDRLLRYLPQFVAVAAMLQLAACAHHEEEAIPPRCTPAWNIMVDHRLGISDDSHHGPDIGSAEWLQAVGLKSGVIDRNGHGPDARSDEWCRAVDYKVFGRR